jgi:hypothetical protein
MVEMKVNASEFKGEESKLFEKLSDFLKDKTGGDVTNDGKTVSIKGEGAAITKKYIKVTVKKFIHKHELTEKFKVIADEEENTLKIKERKIEEEED